MFLHNTMEDLVLKQLQDILENKPDICQCNACRIDMACYALNKLPARYVSSSRGVIHTENDSRFNSQIDIDILSVVKEAIDTISSKRRDEGHLPQGPMINQGSDNKINSKTTFFNFPQIMGRIINSETLEPLRSAKITLMNQENSSLLPMFNERWENPIPLNEHMHGTFTFWPAPVEAEESVKTRSFDLLLKVEIAEDDYLIKNIKIEIESTRNINQFVQKDNIYQMNDIYISREDSEL